MKKVSDAMKTSPRPAECRHAILRQGLMRLDDSDRAILELRHEEGLGNGECAALLGISEKAASLRYVRALKRLKDVLGEYSEFRP